MFLKRNPWVIPLVIVLAVAGLYLAIVTSRSSIDQSELLGSWVTFGGLFVAFAVVALFVYRSLRRSRKIGDEAASVDDVRRDRASMTGRTPR